MSRRKTKQIVPSNRPKWTRFKEPVMYTRKPAVSTPAAMEEMACAVKDLISDPSGLSSFKFQYNKKHKIVGYSIEFLHQPPDFYFNYIAAKEYGTITCNMIGNLWIEFSFQISYMSGTQLSKPVAVQITKGELHKDYSVLSIKEVYAIAKRANKVAKKEYTF